MAPPIDEDRRCETPGKAEWYNLLREAADSSAAFIVARELTLLESVVDDPNATADLEPFRLAKENLEALLQMAPTPGYLSLLAEEGGLQSCPTEQETPPVWMAYSDGGTKRAPVELCHSCQFVGALPLGNLAIDPNNIKTTIDLMVFENLYAGLLVHSGFNSYEFGLADRYEVSPDGLTYRIHLREGLRWSDGAAITSNDLRFAIQRQLTRGNASRNAAELFPIENAEAYFGGEISNFDQVGVKILDPQTIELKLQAPAPLFIHTLARPVLTPLPQHALEGKENPWKDPSQPAVSGAYMVFDFKYEDHLALIPNPNYFRADQVQIANIKLRHSKDSKANADWFDRGEIQYAMQVPIEEAIARAREGKPELQIRDKLCLYMYVMNAKGLTREQRSALVRSVDRASLTGHLLKSGQKPANHFVPPVLWSQGRRENFESYIPFSTEHIDKFFSGRDLKFVFNASPPDHKTIAEFVQRQLADRGSAPQVQSMELGALTDARTRGDFDGMQLSWCADVPDPYDFLKLFVTGDENNYGNYSNLDFDAKVKTSATESDPAKRLALLRGAEAILAKDPPAIPLYYPVNVFLLDPKITGLEPDWSGGFRFEGLRTSP